MSDEVIYDETRGEDISIEKMRVFLYLNVPAVASENEVKPWLVSRGLFFSPEVYSIMRCLHLGDNRLRAWRVEGGESSSLLN